MIVIVFDESGSDDNAGACCGEVDGLGFDDPSHPNMNEPGLYGPGGGRVGAVLLSKYIRPGTVSNAAVQPLLAAAQRSRTSSASSTSVTRSSRRCSRSAPTSTPGRRAEPDRRPSPRTARRRVVRLAAVAVVAMAAALSASARGRGGSARADHVRRTSPAPRAGRRRTPAATRSSSSTTPAGPRPSTCSVPTAARIVATHQDAAGGRVRGA